MPLTINFGLDANKWRLRETESVLWREDRVVNPHMLIVGMTGAGKTHNLRGIVQQMQETADEPVRIHVFDIHGDIDIEGASTVMFSEQTSSGLNPLTINPDPHYGGVRKRIQSFIAVLNRARALGTKQETVIRYLLTDLYADNGFRMGDPATWRVEPPSETPSIIDGRLYLEIPYWDKGDARQLGVTWEVARKGWWISPENYKGAVTRWPPKQAGRRQLTMNDLLNYARTVQRRVFLGANQQAVISLEAFHRVARNYQKKLAAIIKHTEGRAISPLDAAPIDPEAKAELDKAAEYAVGAYTEYVKSVKTGAEMDGHMRYDSADVLKSVVDRLENLNSIGIFRSQTPAFDPGANVWRYHLKALSMEERKLFVLFRLEELFLKALQRGEQKRVREVIILDEAHAFCDDDEDNIINSIAREARKFGLALVAASQAPNHFTDDFLTCVGTKMVLTIDEMFWDGAARKLRLPLESLEWIKPRQNCAIQIKSITESKNVWRPVLFRKSAEQPAAASVSVLPTTSRAGSPAHDFVPKGQSPEGGASLRAVG